MSHFIPLKYILYCHYARGEQDDYKTWKEAAGSAIDEQDLQGVRFLREHRRELWRLLTAPGQEGLLIAFYSPGLIQFLDAITERATKSEIEQIDPLRFARIVRDAIEKDLEQEPDLKRRLRVLTPLDLYDVFGRLHDWNIAGALRDFLVGRSNDALHYDTPKVVEAIVRLRLLGNGLPVFRIDHDVLFNEGNGDVRYLGLYQPISACLKAYELRRDHPRIGSFILSGCYDMESLLARPDGSADPYQEYVSWNRAFATRAAPVLKVLPELAATQDSESYIRQAFDPQLALRFFGLEKEELKINANQPGLAALGAHPTCGVISGALLYLSPGVVLDVPPFSNLRLNVSWIDDHLRYALHRELKQLTLGKDQLAAIEPLLSSARLDGAIVQKWRTEEPNLQKLLRGVLENYLPTLLWGMIFDRWIQPRWLLKFRIDELSEENQALWRGYKKETGALGRALQEALAKGTLSGMDEQRIEDELRTQAVERIKEVVSQWSGLTSGKEETLISSWVKGSVESWLPDVGDRGKGLLEKAESWASPASIRDVDLNPVLLKDLGDLIADTARYVEWTLAWPKVMQVVRSVPQGTLRTDLPWGDGADATTPAK